MHAVSKVRERAFRSKESPPSTWADRAYDRALHVHFPLYLMSIQPSGIGKRRNYRTTVAHDSLQVSDGVVCLGFCLHRSQAIRQLYMWCACFLQASRFDKCDRDTDVPS